MTSRSIRFAWMLLLGSSVSLSIDAMTGEQGAQLGQSVTLPDYGAMMEQSSTEIGSILGHLGGGRLSDVAEQSNLYGQGQGSITGPAQSAVITCRYQSDPTCLAIQVLDKGITDRPHVDEGVLEGRDDVVDHSTSSEVGGVSGSTHCQNVIIQGSTQTVTHTCLSGGFWDVLTCEKGYQSQLTLISSTWQCVHEPAVNHTWDCQAPVVDVTKPVTSVACFWTPSIDANATLTTTQTAHATATFEATCEAPQYVQTEVKCQKQLSVELDTGCTPDDTTEVTVNGSGNLQTDGCLGADTLTLRHLCTTKVSRKHTVDVLINGFEKQVVSANTSISLPSQWSPTCKATIHVHQLTCDDTQTCIADISATIIEGERTVDTMNARMVYHEYRSEGTLVDTWHDDCANLPIATAVKELQP